MTDQWRIKWAKENGLETPYSNAPMPCKCVNSDVCIDEMWYDHFIKPGPHCHKFRARKEGVSG